LIRLTRRYRFSSAHRLHAAQLSDSENRDVYGKCNNPFGHGHNYTVEVSVRGPLEETTGRVVDLQALDALVHDRVVGAFDHKDLNREAPEFATTPPTTENLAIVIRDRLLAGWDNAFPAGTAGLERIRIYETKRNIFEVNGKS
jgi:6-pyruvoyltetrahydropterin/6-carboxytetrahydropterin synthase